MNIKKSNSIYFAKEYFFGFEREIYKRISGFLQEMLTPFVQKHNKIRGGTGRLLQTLSRVDEFMTIHQTMFVGSQAKRIALEELLQKVEEEHDQFLKEKKESQQWQDQYNELIQPNYLRDKNNKFKEFIGNTSDSALTTDEVTFSMGLLALLGFKCGMGVGISQDSLGNNYLSATAIGGVGLGVGALLSLGAGSIVTPENGRCFKVSKTFLSVWVYFVGVKVTDPKEGELYEFGGFGLSAWLNKAVTAKLKKTGRNLKVFLKLLGLTNETTLLDQRILDAMESATDDGDLRVILTELPLYLENNN